MSCQFEDSVAKLCYEKFNALPNTGKPQKNKGWTLLAAVVVSLDDDFEKLKLASLCTGTKCLGYSQYSSKGDLVFDSHAEVLARRAFLRYLYYQMKIVIGKKSSEILFYDETESKFKVKSGMKFHLFISNVPCGDAAIFPKDGTMKRSFSPEVGNENDTSDASKRIKTDYFKLDNQLENVSFSNSVNDIYRTGAKCVESGRQDPKKPGSDYHVTGTLRTKPGRGDPTWSMSCSDKIALWNVCGVQGALMSQLLASPIYLDSIIIGKCPFNKAAMKRAIVDRISGVSNLPSTYLVNQPKIFQSLLPFEFSKENLASENQKIVPCPAALIWCDMPNSLNVSVNGRKQGVTKKNFHKPSSRVEVCQSKLLEYFIQIKEILPQQHINEFPDTEHEKTYFDYKSDSTTYQNVKQIVYETLCGWNRKPRDLLKFKFSDIDVK